jgi:uncharacterized membrane protein YvbJ
LQCPKCTTLNPDSATYCLNCGQEIKPVLPRPQQLRSSVSNEKIKDRSTDEEDRRHDLHVLSIAFVIFAILLAMFLIVGFIQSNWW